MFEYKKTIYKVTQHYKNSYYGDTSEVLGYVLTYKVGDRWCASHFDIVSHEETILKEQHILLWLEGIKNFFEKGEDKEPFYQSSSYLYEEMAIAEFLTHAEPKLRAFVKKYLS